MKTNCGILLMLVLCLSHFFGCSEPEDEGKMGRLSEIRRNSNGLTVGKLILSSEQYQQKASLSNPGEVQECEFSLDKYRGSGICLKAENVILNTTFLEAIDSNRSEIVSGRPARIAATRNPDATESAGEIISDVVFNFSDRDSLTTYNELFFQYHLKDSYDILTVDSGYQIIKFTLKEKFITLLIPAFTQPMSSWSEISECYSEIQSERQSNNLADVFSGMTFQRGDYLFCVKNKENENCAAIDYKWYDLETRTLVNQRPEVPRVHKYLVAEKSSCSTEGDSSILTISPMRMAAKLDETFKLYADYSHGINSVQWKDSHTAFQDRVQNDNEIDYIEPWLVYYYEKDNLTTEGTNLTMEFRFNLKNLIYIDGMSQSSFNSSTLDEILESLYTKHDWYWDKKSEEGTEGFSPEHFSSMTAKAIINLSGEKERPDF